MGKLLVGRLDLGCQVPEVGSGEPVKVFELRTLESWPVWRHKHLEAEGLGRNFLLRSV